MVNRSYAPTYISKFNVFITDILGGAKVVTRCSLTNYFNKWKTLVKIIYITICLEDTHCNLIQYLTWQFLVIAVYTYICTMMVCSNKTTN